MYWIIQEDIFGEPRYPEILDTLERGGIPHLVVKVVPFSHELRPKPAVSNPIAVLGSYTLARIAKAYGWGPGVFMGDLLDYRQYLAAFGERMLNPDARVVPFGELSIEKPTFIRPCTDDKAFAGAVIDPHKLGKWQRAVKRNIKSTEFATLHLDTPIIVAPARKDDIQSEYRLFCVDRKVVSGSRYVLRGKLNTFAEVPDVVMDFALTAIREWTPERAFALDVAMTPDGPRIIEFNNINAAGWYLADVSKVIQAIEALEPGHPNHLD